jgi:hypothetical protein
MFDSLEGKEIFLFPITFTKAPRLTQLQTQWVNIKVKIKVVPVLNKLSTTL